VARQGSFGVWALCGARAGKAAMVRHVRACLSGRSGGYGSVVALGPIGGSNRGSCGSRGM